MLVTFRSGLTLACAIFLLLLALASLIYSGRTRGRLWFVPLALALLSAPFALLIDVNLLRQGLLILAGVVVFCALILSSKT